jgi:riboflavin kinase
MDDILLLLLRHGAHLRPLKMTTTEVGLEAGMSQQNASRKLAVLEEGGYVERGKDGIMLTKKAYEELAAAYSSMKSAFEGSPIRMNGMIVKGLGEGGYYVSMGGYRRQMKEKLGFDPYPGTLNIKIDNEDLWKKQHVLQKDPVTISGFRDGRRSYGDLFAYRCKVDGQDCVLIVPLRTHHGPQIIEVICPFNFKKRLGKKDGDIVKVVV